MHSSIFSIPISGHIELKNESDHETNHKIHIFVATPISYDKESNGVFEHSINDGPFKHTIHFTKAIAEETAICIDLFATVSNFRGAPAYTRIATATIPIRSLEETQTIKMLHIIANVHKADVSLDTPCDMSKLDKVSISSSMEPDESELVIAEAIHADRKLTIKTVHGYDNFINRIRMVPFQTRTMAIPGPAYWDMKSLDVKDSALNQWLEDACHRHSITVADFSRLVANKGSSEGADGVVGAVLGTVCTLYPNTCTYVGDFVWDGKQKRNLDSYESIGTTGSGDCEDLAHGILQIFNAISNRNLNRFTYGPLDALTDVSHRYICVATLGEARKASLDNVFTSGQCAHMWAMLLPRHAIDQHIHVNDNDTCLMLEGTARVHPNISKSSPYTFAEIDVPEPFTRMNYVADMTFYNRVAHIYPSTPVNGTRTFGYTVVSSKPIKKNALASYGVTMENMYSGNYSLWEHTKFNKATRKAIKKVMSFEHPQLHILKHHEPQCEHLKYLINNLTKASPKIGPKTETDMFFVDSKLLSRAACDKFIRCISNSGINITHVSTRTEFNNVLCIKITGYR